MLILTRRVGEILRIDSEVAVTILGIQGQQARIGIQAPAHVQIHREEIFQRIQRELASSGPSHIDDRVKQAATDVDPRRAFARLNPAGFAPEDLEFNEKGFIDKYAQSSYVQFLAGYNAALGVDQ
ncbi:carbon storage regulator [Pseudomonas sp. LS-2]|nr:carbon storage regulator [Pseudomonas sp. LS-2]